MRASILSYGSFSPQLPKTFHRKQPYKRSEKIHTVLANFVQKFETQPDSWKKMSQIRS